MVKQKIINVLLRIAFVFEPLAPKVISYYLNKKLKEMKKSGILSDFSQKTKRLGRYHYLIIVDADLTSIQTINMIEKIFPSIGQNTFQVFQFRKYVFPIIKELYLRSVNH